MVKAAQSPRQTARVVQLRKGTTLEMVRLSCPDATQASKIATSFGTAVVDSDGIRSLHERLIVETAESLSEGLGEKAMQIHLQRIVGGVVVADRVHEDRAPRDGIDPASHLWPTSAVSM